MLVRNLLFDCTGTDKEKSKPAKTSTFAMPTAPSMPLTATSKPWLGLAETSLPGTISCRSKDAQYKRILDARTMQVDTHHCILAAVVSLSKHNLVYGQFVVINAVPAERQCCHDDNGLCTF